MRKQIIRLTENDLHKIIKESVRQIMYESNFDERLRQELTLPQEARPSQMTDDEIMYLLNKHKQEQIDFDAQELAAREKNKQIIPHTFEKSKYKR